MQINVSMKRCMVLLAIGSRVKRIIAVFTAIVVTLLGFSNIAIADPPNGCPPQYICFYNGINDDQPTQIYSTNITRNQCRTVSPNNTTSYIVNNTGVRWLTYQTDGYNCNNPDETPGIIYPYSMGPMNTYNNDRISYTMRTSQTTKN